MGGTLTRASIAEYAAAVRPRYERAGRAERGQILSEFCATTGYHRKAAIRCLRQAGQRPAARRGRPKVHAGAVTTLLAGVWEASGRLRSKRLVPFLPDLLAALERHGEVSGSAEDRAQREKKVARAPDRLDLGQADRAGRGARGRELVRALAAPDDELCRPKTPAAHPQEQILEAGERPPSCALYARMDVAGREVSEDWHATWD